MGWGVGGGKARGVCMRNFQGPWASQRDHGSPAPPPGVPRAAKPGFSGAAPPGSSLASSIRSAMPHPTSQLQARSHSPSADPG